MNRILKTVIAAALVMPALAQADGLNYNYVEAGYARVDADGANGDAAVLRGSLAVHSMWHVFADYQRANFGGGSELDTYDVGLGFNYGLKAGMDVIARAAWVMVDDGSDDEDGFGLQALLRGSPMDKVEVEGGVQYVDLGGNSDETSFVLAGRYSLTNAFAAGLSLNIGDDINTYGVNFRYNFK